MEAQVKQIPEQSIKASAVFKALRYLKTSTMCVVWLWMQLSKNPKTPNKSHPKNNPNSKEQ